MDVFVLTQLEGKSYRPVAVTDELATAERWAADSNTNDYFPFVLGSLTNLGLGDLTRCPLLPALPPSYTEVYKHPEEVEPRTAMELAVTKLQEMRGHILRLIELRKQGSF